jgi:hypothetical protein
MAPRSPTPPHLARPLLLTCLLLAAPGAPADEPRQIPVGYEFATWLGTGLYRIGDRDVWVLSLPFKYELLEATERRMGARVLLPVSIGWLNTRAFDTDDLQTATFIPGLELTFKPKPWWTLRAFAQTGIGRDFSNDDSAWVYAGGVRSRAELSRGDYRFALGTALVAAGSQSGGEDSSFGRLDLGLGVERPLPWRLFDRGTKVSAFYVASFFSDNADFITSLDEDAANLGTVHNFGLALGVQRPFRLLGIRLEWLGISYLTGHNIEGFRFNAGFPF